MLGETPNFCIIDGTVNVELTVVFCQIL